MSFVERVGGSSVFLGDCVEVMQRLGACGQLVDSVVSDPPYHLTSVVDRFGGDNAAPARGDVYARSSAGFMGKKWDGGDIAFQPDTWRAAYDMLKPGGYLVAFGGTRTYHRMVCAIEDAGFEIRDCLFWIYGTGFPKSHDIAKAIDKTLGVKGTYGDAKTAAHAGWIERGTMRADGGHEGLQRPWMDDPEAVDRAAREYIPGSEQAAEWVGYGTALKPACEPIVLARKPIVGTIARNVLAHRTGGLHIDVCKVGSEVLKAQRAGQAVIGTFERQDMVTPERVGRWPANVLHDGSDEVLAAFPDARGQIAPASTNPDSRKTQNVYGAITRGSDVAAAPRGDAGSAARFFYTAKASASERVTHCDDCGWRVLGKRPPHCPECGSLSLSGHPTVKPQALMQWLVRLVTPAGGTVLDPFAGSGSTGCAATAEGFRSILIESDPDSWADSLVKLPGERHGWGVWR